MPYKKVSQSEIMPEIIAEINNVFPVKKPRLEDSNNRELVVSIVLGYNNNSDIFSSIGFMSGNNNYKESTNTSFCLDDLINSEIIIQLISHFLKCFPHISNINLDSRGLEIEFDIPLELEDQEGISCRRVIFEMATRDKSLDEYLKVYIQEIFLCFENEITATPAFIAHYKKYARGIIKQMLAGLEKDAMIKILKLMSNEQLRKLLEEVPEDLFFELYEQVKPSDSDFVRQMVLGE